MTLQSVLGCKVCSALEKQSVPRSKVFFDAKCASASEVEEAAEVNEAGEVLWPGKSQLWISETSKVLNLMILGLISLYFDVLKNNFF